MNNSAMVETVSTVQGVVALDFHPTVSLFTSDSRDCMVKFFDYSKPSAMRSYCSIPEVATARCLVFHPLETTCWLGQNSPHVCTKLVYREHTNVCTHSVLNATPPL